MSEDDLDKRTLDLMNHDRDRVQKLLSKLCPPSWEKAELVSSTICLRNDFQWPQRYASWIESIKVQLRMAGELRLIDIVYRRNIVENGIEMVLTIKRPPKP